MTLLIGRLDPRDAIVGGHFTGVLKGGVTWAGRECVSRRPELHPAGTPFETDRT
ncbi:hypothetical protein ABZ914_01200 [Spirillospora sp. NPDC046719]